MKMMIHKKFGKCGLGLIALCLVLATRSLPAQAQESSMGYFAGLDLGAWKYWFTQGGNGQSIKHSGDVSLGFQGSAGVRVSIFFIEYTPAYFIATVGETPDALERDANDASWSTYKAGNIGLALPLIPLDLYAGGGHSCLDFSFGADSEYCGLFGRVGANIVLSRASYGSLRIKAEYIRQFISTDEAGALPAEISSSANSAFIGLSFSFGGK